MPDKQQVLQKMVAATIMTVIGNWIRWPLKSHWSPSINVTLKTYCICSQEVLSHFWPSYPIWKISFFIHKLSMPELLNWALPHTSHNMKCLLGVLTKRVPWPNKFKRNCIMYPFSWRVIRNISTKSFEY